MEQNSKNEEISAFANAIVNNRKGESDYGYERF